MCNLGQSHAFPWICLFFCAALTGAIADVDIEPELKLQLGHSRPLHAVIVSHDGRLVVTAGGDNAVILWDRDSETELRRFQGHTDAVWSVALSPDNRILVTGSRDGTARVWAVTDGAELQRFGGSAQTLASRRLSERRAAAVLVTAVDISPSGELIVIGTGRDAVVREVRTGNHIRDFVGHADRVESVAFSPDGRFVLTGSKDHTARLWDSVTGETVAHFNGHSHAVQSVAFCGIGRVATGSRDRMARLWDSETGQMLQSFAGHNDVVTAVSCSSDSVLILTASKDGTARTWDAKSGREIRRVETRATQMRSVGLSSDGQLAVTGTETGAAIMWNSTDGGKSRRFESRSSPVRAVAFSPNERFLLTGGTKGTSSLWDLESGRQIVRFRGHAKWVQAVAFSPDSRHIVTGGTDKTARLWDIQKGTEREILKAKSLVQSVSFSPDGRRIATASIEGIELWDASSGSLLTGIAGDFGPSLAAAFLPDSRSMIGSYGKTAHIWSVPGGVELKRLAGHTDRVTSVAASPDGTLVATGSRDGSARIWDVATGAQQQRFEMPATMVMSVTFSHDGDSLIVATTEGEVWFWNLETARETQRLEGVPEGLMGIAASPNGEIVGTAHSDGTTRLWSVSSGKEIVRLMSIVDGTWVVTDLKGRFDTDNLEKIRGLHWMMPDEPNRPLPLEIFMREYYEPRLLSRILAGEEFPHVRPLADLSRVQPRVEIAGVTLESCTPEPCSADTVSVRVAVWNASREFQRNGTTQLVESGVYDLRLFRDGRLVRSAPSLRELWEKEAGLDWAEDLERWQQSTQIELDEDGNAELIFDGIPLPSGGGLGNVEFTAYAFNADKVKSATAAETFQFPEVVPRLAKAYVVAIGMNVYENPSWNLTYAAADAQAIAEVIEESLRQAGRYQPADIVIVPLISNIDAPEGAATTPVTKARIKAVFDLLAGKPIDSTIKQSIPNARRLEASTPDDLVLITYSGHGLADERGDFHLFPYDIGSGDVRKVDDQLFASTVSSAELSVWLRDVDAGELVMVVDACNSAASVEGGGFKPGPMGSRGLGQLAYDKRMRILAASQAEAVALESQELRHGLLTYALIREGLQAGRANREPEDEVIHLGEWLAYGAERVPSLYKELADGTFKPTQNYKGARPVGRAGARRTAQEPGLFDFARLDGNIVLRRMSH